MSMNLGIGRMNPTLKLSFDMSLSLIVFRVGCVSGGYNFLSFSLKSGITFLTALFFDCDILVNLFQITFGRLAMNSSLIFLSSGLYSMGSRIDCYSSKRASILSLEY
jgi:hypothetical protein